jgi:hypothetical protein
MLGGFLAALPLVREYLRFRLRLPHDVPLESHLAIVGMFFIIAGFMNFGFTLVLHAATKE